MRIKIDKNAQLLKIVNPSKKPGFLSLNNRNEVYIAPETFVIIDFNGHSGYEFLLGEIVGMSNSLKRDVFIRSFFKTDSTILKQ
jgi:hypothetical protein